eukprot:TRINITY_DN48408_c0_g1_i1.p1 TRINITY_DN48408_c0_g1~~TRINITY_DN48408_c0_g1_i1.p1  ORF type:complete len:684 (+),score=76.64 TRINITY_DN48408_c0_g1_i1:30-2081(+)
MPPSTASARPKQTEEESVSSSEASSEDLQDFSDAEVQDDPFVDFTANEPFDDQVTSGAQSSQGAGSHGSPETSGTHTPSQCSTAATHILSRVREVSEAVGSVPDGCQLSTDATAVLALSCHEGVLSMVDRLLKAGVNPNSFAKTTGSTPLHLACEAGHVEVAQLLISHKADVNSKTDNDDEATPLYLAAVNNHPHVVDLLLQNGAECPTSEEAENNPFYMACQEGNTEVVKLLLKAAPSWEWADNGGGSAGHAALYVGCQNGHTEVVDLLLQQKKPLTTKNVTTTDGDNQNNTPTAGDNKDSSSSSSSSSVSPPTADVASSSPSSCCGDSKEYCWATDGPIYASFTPLYAAAMHGHLQILKHLLERGAMVNTDSPDGSTPIMAASQEGNVDCVKALVAVEGISLDRTRITDGATALYLAAEAGYPDVAKLLVDAGAQCNTATTEDGSTPLIVASQCGNVEVVSLLLKSGCDVNAARNRMGCHASPLSVACVNGHVEVVKLLVSNGADINQPTIEQETPLYVAAREGFEDIVEVLIQQEAIDMNAISPMDDACTPLHVACAGGHEEVVKILLESNRCTLEAENDEGLTPLQLAVAEPSTEEVVELLLQHKADVNHNYADEGCNALWRACKRNRVKNVGLLLAHSAKLPPSLDLETAISELEGLGRNIVCDLLRSAPSLTTAQEG